VDYAGDQAGKELGVGPWWSKFDQSEQFPNENNGGWMDSEFHRRFPEFDREIFDEWIVRITSLSQILEAPLCVEVKQATPAAVPVVVDGDVLPARPSSTPDRPAPKSKVKGRSKNIRGSTSKRPKRRRDRL